jgi:hypothetical protein
MAARSAQVNILPYLRRLGIIDEDAKTGDRAKQWRDDTHYSQVCKEILAEVYPQELRDAVTEVSQRAEAERWFAHKTGTGETAARKMAALYMVLLEGDASKQPEQDASDRPKDRATKTRETGTSRVPAAPTYPPAANTHNQHQPPSQQKPGININVEIHISADSTPEQIEQIFASMAKHIYKAG